jgi:hypothetical protein
MWTFICERLFVPTRASRLFACLNFTAESTMMLCNNHAESFHSKLKRSGFYKTLRHKNMAEALKVLRLVHLDIQASCANDLAKFNGASRLRKWHAFPLSMAFVGFLELIHASDYLIGELSAMMWYPENSDRGGTPRELALGLAARVPSVPPAEVERLQGMITDVRATNLKVLNEDVLLDMSKVLDAAGAYGVFEVVCVKAATASSPAARKVYHLSSTAKDGVSCDCWYSCGKKMLCCHAFFVIRRALDTAAQTLDARRHHASLSYLVYTWLNPTRSVWFGNRAPM